MTVIGLGQYLAVGESSRSLKLNPSTLKSNLPESISKAQREHGALLIPTLKQRYSIWAPYGSSVPCCGRASLLSEA